MTARASGGARDTERKRRTREAARKRGKLSTQAMLLAREQVIGKPPEDPRNIAGYICRAQALLAFEAMVDKGMPIEQSREQASRILAAAGKSVDAAKLRAELDELMAMLNRGTDAPAVDGEQARGGAAAAQH